MQPHCCPCFRRQDRGFCCHQVPPQHPGQVQPGLRQRRIQDRRVLQIKRILWFILYHKRLKLRWLKVELKEYFEAVNSCDKYGNLEQWLQHSFWNLKGMDSNLRGCFALFISLTVWTEWSNKLEASWSLGSTRQTKILISPTQALALEQQITNSWVKTH